MGPLPQLRKPRIRTARAEAGIFVVKFYRPGRWTTAAIREEHGFLRNWRKRRFPWWPPYPTRRGDTLSELAVESAEGERPCSPFALFPKRAGRGFDAETRE
jgi:Ser/Thr protein kinase RdoA (MazF antagonist)